MFRKNHICVCICKYKRPKLLRRLFANLESQKTGGSFDYSIVIVHNDSAQSAHDIAKAFLTNSEIKVSYFVEPERNIALARNKAMRNAKGDFIALIDDELPVEQWLLNVYKAIDHYKSYGILAPVIPHFEKKPPKWVLKGRFFDKPTHQTGHVLAWRNTRTGNALLRRGLFKEDRNWFDPAFGSGGEDRDFFRRKITEGHVFIWCKEAPVYEIVPPKRWKRTVLMKTALLRGKMALSATKSRAHSVLNSLPAIAIYTACLPHCFGEQ